MRSSVGNGGVGESTSMLFHLTIHDYSIEFRTLAAESKWNKEAHSERSSTPEYIISERLIVSTLIWEVESKVHTVLEWVKPLPGCPPSRLFVLEGLRSDVIQWGHCSKLACHPGVNLTSFLIKQRFWWHSMGCGVQDFVFACSVCARGKTTTVVLGGPIDPQTG